MARQFPMLGDVDRCGLRGMFIAETHTDSSVMERLLERWPQFSTQIDVLYRSSRCTRWAMARTTSAST